MTFSEKLKLVFHILRWRLTWSRHKLDYKPSGVYSPKFISAREAAELIADEACVFSSGIAGNARCAIFFYAIRNRFVKTGHPKGLTWINCGGQGSRGRVPGTIEEMGIPGLMSTYIAAHLETVKAQLKLGQNHQLEIHTLPQGVMSLLLEAQGKGETSIRSQVGVGTFLDPRTGSGSIVNPPATASYISDDRDAMVYTMPQPDVALFNAPYADAEGNVYFKHASTMSENIQSIQSVRHGGGIVMATASKIIPKSSDEVSIPAKDIDYLVVNPYNEQATSVLQHSYWPLFTPECKMSIHDAVLRLKFVNTILKITPVRGSLGEMMGRVGASLFVQNIPKGSMVNIGVGFPEEVARLLVEHELEKDYVFTTEGGSYGGLPAPGIFFGAAIHPDHLESSSKMFRRYQKDLDVAVLGFLQVDSQGNVNVSKRGPNVTDYVGPGGFPDIVHGAKTIIFIGKWMHNAKVEIQGDQVKLVSPGVPKFVEQVNEVTFNGQEGIRAGKKVFYVTDVGIFQLTSDGVALNVVFPGIDIQKDILANTAANIILPSLEKMEEIGPEILNGAGFNLAEA